MRTKRILSLAMVAGLGIFGLCGFTHATAPTDSENVDLELNVSSRITVALSTDTVTLNLKPTTSTDFDSANLTATVATNNATGYTLTMSPSDGTSTSLTRVNGEETIPTLAELSGGYTEQTFTTNRWGYKLASSNYLNFTTSNQIAVTNAPSASSANVVTFASKGDTSLRSGTYGLEIAFTAVANAPLPTAYNVATTLDSNTTSVTFSDGTNTLTATSASPTVALTANTQYTITANFAAGYELSSWTAGSNATIGSTSANPTTLTVTGASTLQVDSQQEQAQVYTIANGGTMQNVSSVADGGCPSTLTTGQVYTLTDSRDNQTYNVARLADGKCWMVENLNLPGGTALSADDTDVTSAYISSFSTSNNLTKTSDTIVLPASSILGFDLPNYSYVYNSGNKANNCTLHQPCYSYYSWDAATLGSGRSISTDNTDAEQSICPKGWKLPNTRTGTNSTSDFRALMIALGGSDSIETYDESTTPTGATMSSALKASPYNYNGFSFIFSDEFVDDGCGYYWSATSDSNSVYARNLRFLGGEVDLTGINLRDDGLAVRCLLR